jgi:hypothetical protein
MIKGDFIARAHRKLRFFCWIHENGLKVSRDGKTSKSRGLLADTRAA